MSGNVLIYPPPEVAEQGVKAVRDYMMKEELNRVTLYILFPFPHKDKERENSPKGTTLQEKRLPSKVVRK